MLNAPLLLLKAYVFPYFVALFGLVIFLFILAYIILRELWKRR
jgi:hypothetical protein